MNEIAYIEDHDARVDGVHLRPSGRCEVSFSHLAVYCRTEPKEEESEAYEIRSHPALLVLDGVTKLVCAEEIGGGADERPSSRL